MAAKKTEAELELSAAELQALEANPFEPTEDELELSSAELEALEANPRRPRKKKKKRKSKKPTIPRDGLGRFAPKIHAT